MTDKMPDVIYTDTFHRTWTLSKTHTNGAYPAKGRHKVAYIRQDSINVPDGLEEAIERVTEAHYNSERPEYFDLKSVVEAARELQRIKGLK